MSGGSSRCSPSHARLMSDPRCCCWTSRRWPCASDCAQVFDEIRESGTSGGTVLIVEQNAAAALRVADRAYVMKTGQIVDERSAADLLADDTIAETYLGGTAGNGTMEDRLRARAISGRLA